MSDPHPAGMACAGMAMIITCINYAALGMMDSGSLLAVNDVAVVTTVTWIATYRVQNGVPCVLRRTRRCGRCIRQRRPSLLAIDKCASEETCSRSETRPEAGDRVLPDKTPYHYHKRQVTRWRLWSGTAGDSLVLQSMAIFPSLPPSPISLLPVLPRACPTKTRRRRPAQSRPSLPTSSTPLNGNISAWRRTEALSVRPIKLQLSQKHSFPPQPTL